MEQIVTKSSNFLSSFPQELPTDLQNSNKLPSASVASASVFVVVTPLTHSQVVTTGGWTDADADHHNNDSFQRQRKTFPGALPTPSPPAVAAASPPPPSSVTWTDNTRATRAWPVGCRKGIASRLGRLSKNITSKSGFSQLPAAVVCLIHCQTSNPWRFSARFNFSAASTP